MWCRRRVKRVCLRVVKWKAKGKTRDPHIRDPFARGRRFLLVPVTAAASPDVLFVCNIKVFRRRLCPFVVVCALSSCKLLSAAGPDSISS